MASTLFASQTLLTKRLLIVDAIGANGANGEQVSVIVFWIYSAIPAISTSSNMLY